MKALWVYNANEPDQNTRLSIKDIVIKNEQYKEIVEKCKPGPYLAFFQDLPAKVFRLRGPFCDSQMKAFYIVDCTGLQMDDNQKAVADKVFKSNEF